ncbi:hypothetical protein PR202_gb25156 [Eleusine coracana subsp. coracana]|uniref:R13L1/DRL21-like LRR repeat region domain-containing protein n=1 Tax=Eleusine coracana subsp. coracana TaxID=191504 RepID=A0AAV5FKL9_ELECO|nr:hypothetical protein PR202_gb25156 [Eleusine coracana subsp. coracana]
MSHFPADTNTLCSRYTGSSCSSMGELRLLDLGGYLEIDQLENVTETDAQEANLQNKKSLTELKLQWRDPSSREPQHHHKVLEGLEAHGGIKVLKIFFYGGSTYPTWISTLQYVVELTLSDCSKIEKLPPLWQLPALQVLRMAGMENLHCLCSGDPPFTFKKLKDLSLRMMPNLETWWDINEAQGQESIFPELEDLTIGRCGGLVHWPENVFRHLVALRKLRIEWCNKLTGRTQDASDQCTLLPRLESLELLCRVLLRLGSGDYVLIRQEESARCSEAVAVPLPIDMSSSNLSLPVSLHKLTIGLCANLQSLSVHLDCTELLCILRCPRLKSLNDDGHLTSLEHLRLQDCESLESIPAGPHQAYSSLRYLEIKSCPRLKLLPPCLKQRLNDIEETDLDACYTGNLCIISYGVRTDY